MNSIRLTTRGKIVLAVAILAAFWFAVNAVTPEECKVAAESLSAGCEAYLR